MSERLGVLVFTVAIMTAPAAIGVASTAENGAAPVVARHGFQPVALGDIAPAGELRERLVRNLDRLQEEKYRPEHVFLTRQQNKGWPGDTEGRTVLALVLEAQALKVEPRYLATIIGMFPEKMNAQGYFGDILPEGFASEQQLASHGWVLRCLAEYYLWSHDDRALGMIDRIIENLVLPTAGLYATYPLEPDKRAHKGGASGSELKGASGPWRLSTDIGCIHILMDGLIQCYQLRPDPRVKGVIEEMIGLFKRIDQVRIEAQTHATLTALRGLLRWHEVTGDPALVALVEEKFALYKREAMTENYENYNWFGRPSWTEPCAVVDSYLLALQLWQRTGRTTYLEDADHIYFNAIALAQRANGGFGLQTCSGANDDPDVAVKLQEAHWCCTMRGGEGLVRADQSTFMVDAPGNEVAAITYRDCDAVLRFGDRRIKLTETTGYPFAGNTRIEVRENTMLEPVTLKLFIAPWWEGERVTVDGRGIDAAARNGFIAIGLAPGERSVIELKGTMKLGMEPVHNTHSPAGLFTVRHGPLILGCNPAGARDLDGGLTLKENGEAVYRVAGNEVILEPLFHLMDPEVRTGNFRRQILFTGPQK